jgi:Mg-chelatase subunit ChlD
MLSEKEAPLEYSDVVVSKSKKHSRSKTISWKPSTQADNNAVIKLGETESLQPQAIDISVQIDGFRARVVIDGFYTNPHKQNLEGSFKFRLPNGATPYFFAFGETATSLENDLESPIIFDSTDTPLSRLSPQSIMSKRENHWRAPKEAIMVSKEKAAYAYNETVARQVDPALLEWAGAGIFSAKVFPLQANKTHRVVIGYDVNLKQLDNDLIFDLPVTKQSINKRIQLFVNQKAAKQVLLQRIVNDELLKAEVISKNNELVEQTIQQKDLDGIRVSIQQHGHVALMGQDKSGAYFARQWKVDLPTTETISNPRAVFAIDTSLSASPEKFHLWVNLIQKILETNETEIREFALVSFNIDSHWWKESFVKNTEDQRSVLLNYLNTLILEGATDLSSALSTAVAPAWLVGNNSRSQEIDKNFDLFLLSDGAITWGEKEAYFISESVKKMISEYHTVKQLYTYRLGLSGENTELLSHLTREIGGANFQLSNDSNIQQLATAHKSVPWKINSINFPGAQDILISGRPDSVYPGQLITLAGRLESSLADEMIITFTKGELSKQATIPFTNIIDSTLAARVFGQIAVNQLESISALESKIAAAFANHFRVPGQSSSLLMLESKEDYERYNIKPSEDTFVAGHKLVSEIFTQLGSHFAIALSDPRKRLKDQLKKLEKMTFIDFEMSPAVSILIDEIPKEAFSINTDFKLSKKIDNNHLPNSYANILKKESIQYDVIQTEALRRLEKYGPQDAIKVVSSLVEKMPSDVSLSRDVAFTAESLGLYQQAFALHSVAANLRPYEPQSYTYLAKLAQQLNKHDLALIYFEIGLASQWSDRFGDYQLIHKLDYANFLRKSLEQNDKKVFFARDYAKLKLQTLNNDLNLTGSDLIVAISWNTDRTDIDLHIMEPSGEECYYRHNKTESGGFITRDVTQGFGPEMYVNKKAPEGTYDIYVEYFATDQNKLGLKTKVLIRSIRNWGTKEEQQQIQTVSLHDSKQRQLIASLKI